MARPPVLGELNKVVRSQEGLLKFEECEKNASKTVRRNESLLIFGASRTSPPTMSSARFCSGFEFSCRGRKAPPHPSNNQSFLHPNQKPPPLSSLKSIKIFPADPKAVIRASFGAARMCATLKSPHPPSARYSQRESLEP